jgi:integrase
MTGLRKGELLALRWKDVDWSAGRIRVRQNYVRGEFGTPKSKRSTRSVPLADDVAGELDRLYTRSRRQGDGDLVFAHPQTGNPLPKANVTRRMRAALKAAKLDTAHRGSNLSGSQPISRSGNRRIAGKRPKRHPPVPVQSRAPR